MRAGAGRAAAAKPAVLSLYHGEDAASRSSSGSSGSLQPLLLLRRLQTVRLHMRCGAPAAAELAALSSISSLKEVKLLCIWEQRSAPHLRTQLGEAAEAAAEGGAAAWLTLPVKALQWHSYRMLAAVVQRAGALQGLTSLQLLTDCEDVDDGLVPAQLAAMLQPLTGLRQLQLACNGSRKVTRGSAAALYSVGEVPGYECGAVAALMQAVGGLRELADVSVHLQMQLSEAAVVELRSLQQELLPCWMARICKVDARLLSI